MTIAKETNYSLLDRGNRLVSWKEKGTVMICTGNEVPADDRVGISVDTAEQIVNEYLRLVELGVVS